MEQKELIALLDDLKRKDETEWHNTKVAILNYYQKQTQIEDTIAWKAFCKYLNSKNSFEYSIYKNPDMFCDYPTRIKEICRKESFSTWDDLAKRINEILDEYSSTSKKSKFEMHNLESDIKALELFRDFYKSL